MSRLQRLRKSLTQFPDIEPPSAWLLASEARAVWEFWAGIVMYAPVKHLSAQGDGHPVLVLPGLGASDASTALLRRFIDDLGYASYPWELGRNRGFQDETHGALQGRLNIIFHKHQQKVSVIGQSLGGVYARELAKIAPEKVRQVITLGSPFSGHPLASTGIRMYEWLSGDNIENMDFDRHHAIRRTPPVPTTSVYSKLDGIVAWKCSIEAGKGKTENIHLRGGTHCGMASSPAALYLVADRLAQKPEHWEPFDPRGAARAFYGIDDHHGALIG
ncbi:MAG: alpha/beta hydrolase [Burkholderiales bacterium PBB4]|nr:MAG: alpha/beta hydrolase [Burkholderiales bacterium PBB4]